MPSKATTVAEYLKELPEDRRKSINALRKVFKANIGKGIKEGMQYGMIGYFVPHSIYPDGYHCDPKQPLPFAGIGNQKGHIGLYLFCTYCDPIHKAWFTQAWKDSGKKLDMGKACVRVKSADDVPMEVMAEALQKMPVDRFIGIYESNIPAAAKRKAKAGAKKAAGKKKVSKKKATKKKVVKKKASTTAAAKR